VEAIGLFTLNIMSFTIDYPGKYDYRKEMIH